MSCTHLCSSIDNFMECTEEAVYNNNCTREIPDLVCHTVLPVKRIRTKMLSGSVIGLILLLLSTASML